MRRLYLNKPSFRNIPRVLISLLISGNTVILPCVQYAKAHLHFSDTLAIVHWHPLGNPPEKSSKGPHQSKHQHSRDELLKIYGTQSEECLQKISPEPALYNRVEHFGCCFFVENIIPRIASNLLSERSPPNSFPT